MDLHNSVDVKQWVSHFKNTNILSSISLKLNDAKTIQLALNKRLFACNVSGPEAFVDMVGGNFCSLCMDFSFSVPSELSPLASFEPWAKVFFVELSRSVQRACHVWMSVRLEVSSRKMDVVALWEYYHSTLGKPTHVKVFGKWHLRECTVKPSKNIHFGMPFLALETVVQHWDCLNFHIIFMVYEDKEWFLTGLF